MINFREALLDILFPKKCVHCKKWGEYLCEECEAAVEGRAYEKWQRSLEPDEDGGICADPLLCWDCYCWEVGMCPYCEEALTNDLTCPNSGCEMYGRRV